VIYAGTNGYLDDLDVAECVPFEQEMYKYADVHDKDLQRAIVQKGSLDDELKARIKKLLDAFKEEFRATRAKAS